MRKELPVELVTNVSDTVANFMFSTSLADGSK